MKKYMKKNMFLRGREEHKNSLFKPIVATSLALALGVSVASAYTLDGLKDTTSNTPLNIANVPSTTSDITISNNSEDSGYNSLKSDGTEIVSLEISYGATDITSGSATFNGSIIQINNTNTTFASTDGKGLMMGKSGGWFGELSISSGTDTNRTFTLDLSNITDKTKYAFNGYMKLKDGAGRTIVKLGGKGISEKLEINGGNNEVIFTGSDAETNKLWSSGGTTTFTFKGNATIRGGDGSGIIYVGSLAAGLGIGGQTFYFNGANNIIENTKAGGPAIDISANKNNSNLNNTYNRLLFKNGTNTIKGKIQSQINANDVTGRSGKNTIVFENGTTSNTIEGEIYSWFGYNTIVFAGASNSASTLDNLSTTANNKLIGNITSYGLNATTDSRINNLVYFKEDGYIKGNINATTNETGFIPYSRNMVVFEKKGYIKGNVTGSNVNAWANRNYLVFKDDAKIEGSVGEATNSILLSGTNKTLTITGGVSGTAKIWGTSTSLPPISTPLDYNSDETYKDNVVAFFNTTPNNDTLIGNLNIQNGSQGALDFRADTMVLDNNTTDANNTFALKTTGSSTLVAKNATINGNILSSANTNITFLTSGTADINGSIKATSGTNTMNFQGETTISGDIVVQNGGNVTNVITANKITFDGSNQGIYASGGWNAKNILIFQGETNFGNNFSIRATSLSNATKKDNILKFDTNSSLASNQWNISELTASMDSTSSQNGGFSSNILDFGALSSVSVTIGNINNQTQVSNNGGLTSFNYIGKTITKDSGSSLALMDNFNTSWNTSDHQANIALNVTGDIFMNNSKSANYINAKSINANTITATGGANNIAFGADSQVSGNISKSNGGANNFTFTADSGTLTLKGQTNQISNLTALDSATIGDTLIIDGTTNANNTTIDTLTNGGSLIVKFKGQGESNGATLNLKSTPTLKQVIVNNNSTKNTLDLTQTTKTTINTKIAIADTQQLEINLNNTELALATDSSDSNLGLKTTGTGVSTININTSGTLSGGDIVATNLNLDGTANATLKSANTTFANLIANGGTVTLGDGSSNATINSTDSTFNATFAGTTSQTLAINGGTNTISTLALGTLTAPDSTTDTLSIGGGSTTITNAITSDTNNNLTLQIGSSDSSKSASLTLSGAITTNDTGVANVIFTGSTTASSNLATLTLKGSSNTLTGVTTQTANALIEAWASTSNLGTLTFSGANETQSLQINGGENTITSLALSNANNILTQNAGNTTIESAISVGANQNLTLKIGSNIEPEKPRSSSIVLSDALTITDSTSGVANLVFEGGSSPSQTNQYSALVLTKGTSQFSSIDSKSSNAMLILKNSDLGTPSVSVGSQITIEDGKSLTIGFLGTGDSTATASQGIVVNSGGTLGIAIGGASGNKKIDIPSYNFKNIFKEGSTLRIDFLRNAGSTGIIGDGSAISIESGRKSMINFYGGSGNPSLQGGISLDGGENEVNFYGSATLGNIALNSGTNTIRVKRDLTGFTATIENVNATDGTGLGKVTNYIYLEENATLKLGTAGDQVLTSTDTTKPSTLNFIGTGATLQGGFGASGGSAIINVGLDEFYDADKGTEFIGTITGAVTNASLNFNAGKSILTLQSQTNTFTTINSKATKGVLVLDTSATGGNGVVNATILGKTTINTGKSLSFDFQGDNDSTITTTGGLVIDGTLGVIISGSGAKKVEGDIDLNGRGTLYVNYAGGNATVTLGSLDDKGQAQGITIREGESSIIDFNSTSGTLANALTLDGGSNTINFNQNASLDKITLTSGNNTFNVADSITATIGNTSAVGGVHNTINLGADSIIDLQNGDSQSGSGSIITSLNNTLNFNGSGATLKGSFGASENGSARVKVAGSNSVITGSLSNASITFSSDNADLTLQSGNSTITSLQGFTAPSTYTRNGRTIASTITNTLTLDGTTDVSATITSAVVGDSVGLKFGDGGESKTFTFSASGNHLTGVAFGTTSTNNTLAFTNGNSTLDSVTLESGSDLTIKLGGDANLTLTGGYAKGSGTFANLSIIGNAGIIANSQTINVDTLSFDNTTASSLSVSNSGANTFASVNASKAGTLIANDSNLTITALTGNNLTAGFSGNSASRITINGTSPITLAGVVLNGATSDNTLDLTALTNTTITNNVSVGANQSLAINLGGTSSTLTFSGGLSGNATINANATTSNTIAGSSIALSNLNLSGTDNTTTLKANSATINTLNANATGTNTLKLDATSGNVSASINSIGSTTRGVGDLNIALNGSAHTTTLSLNGNTINSLDIQGDKNTLVGNAKITSLASANGGTLNINGGNVEVTNKITPTTGHNIDLALNNGANLYAVAGLDSTNGGNGTDQINLTLNNSTLSLGATSTITSLSGNGGVIDFVSSGENTSKSLTISGDCNANANVKTYVDTSSSDKANLVTVSGTNSTGILTISAYGDADEIFSITYDANDTNGTNVKVAEGVDKAIGGTSDIEGEIIQITLTPGATKGDWYIGSAISKGVDTSVQEVVTSALAVNYDLYLANFNSLNKRMGELRNTQESNGVWARVFGGAMSNDFGVGSKTDYLTTQAGYDYSLSVGENARNFIGVAIAYGASSTKSNPSSNPNTGVLDNISSSMIEVGLYNSYVADSGWYNDTIFKFDYIMSDFTLKTGSNSQQNSTSNFAMILSDEFGYRYSFGENEKGSWYIDPQAEVAFGYFNQSDFNQALNESATRTIKATQDSILTLRSRVGASLGKKFNTDKGFASLYVGAFYEYDYIEGGKSDYALISSQGEVSNPLQSLESNGRAILNVGSNIELTKGARLYIDVEKSFGDKQRTFMQFNLGARYSF